MSAVFLKILNMSITASWLIPAVILVRLLLKRAPKWISCLLWGLVAIRLICPFSFESVLSLIPSSETIPAGIALQPEPAIHSGIWIVNEAVNPIIAESLSPAPGNSANPLQILIPVAAIVWLTGIVIMLAYALISYLKLKETVSAGVPVGERLLACDEVQTPLILGVIRPIIFVPSSINGKTFEHVVRHEKAHLQRHDHWWKPLGYLLLSIYWFNPLCWVGYILLCRDIEMACDEKVIRDMDKENMAAYSQALLDCSFPRKRIAACPLAFGEVGVKERVKGVLNYKKPAFWIIPVAMILCIVLAVCLMTNPRDNFMIDRLEVEKVTYFNMFIGDDCQGELNSAQIDEMVERLSAIHKAKKSNRYEGQTPGYQLCVFMKDGSLVYASGYHALDDMVEIVMNGCRYSVSDSDFAKYLRNICSHGDTTPAIRVTTTDLDIIRESYPEYFDLETSKGLEVYVWQMAPEGYSFGLLPGTNREKNLEELWSLKGASAEEMRAILSTYVIDEKDIIIIPWQNPISSYLGEYWISQQNEDPAAAEKRRREYIDGIRQMLFDTAQNGGYDLPNAAAEIKTTVAYANWAEGAMIRGCLNGETMVISSVLHLPVYKLDTMEDLKQFQEKYRDVLTFDQGYNEVPSFNEVTEKYDDSFFADHTVILAYVEANSGSYRFGIQEVVFGDSWLCLNVVQTNHPEVGTDDMAGWLVMAEVLDADIADITLFDAKLVKRGGPDGG